MKAEVIHRYFEFAAGGGEMADLIKAKEWERTVLGAAEDWPQSLKTTLSIILHSRFPMFLWWGPELICFYNDAYRPSLGNNGKHPSILGMPAKDAWTEIWDVIKPLIDQVIAEGKSTYSEDQLIPIYRNGRLEDVYWTFSYSAVTDETGGIAGVLVTCYETTQKVNNLKLLQETNEQLQFAIEATELATWDLNPITNKFTANERYAEWFGIAGGGEEIDSNLSIKVIAEEDREKVIAVYTKVLDYSSGSTYDLEFKICPVNKPQRILKAKGKAWFNDEKICYRFSGTLQDITKESIAHKNIEETVYRYRTLIEESSVATALYTGSDITIQYANDLMIAYWGKDNFIIGKKLSEALPEREGQYLYNLLNKVYTTGEPYIGYEEKADLIMGGVLQSFYFNFTYKALRDKKGKIYGIHHMAIDVTKAVLAKKALEESDRRFQNLIKQATVGIIVLIGEEMIVKIVNDAYGKLIDRTYPELIGKPLFEIIPETESYFRPIVDRVRIKGEPIYMYGTPYFVWVEKEKKEGFLNLVYQPYKEADGKITGVMILCQDVTSQVLAARKIEESEKEFRQLADSLPELVWTTNNKGEQLFASKRWIEFTDVDPYDINTFQQIVHPDDWENVIKTWSHCLAAGITYKTEVRLKSKSGNYCWFYVHGEPVRNESGEIEKWVGAYTNVNEQKRAEENTRLTSERFQLLADAMLQFVWTGDAEGNLNYFNKAVYDYSGLSLDQIQKDGWLQIVHPEEREENIRQWLHAVSTGTDFVFSHRFLKHDGQYRWQLSRATPQRDAAGKIQMWVGTSTDINELKELDQQKDYFIGLVSHELKTPITSMKGYVQILQIKYDHSEDTFFKNSLEILNKQIITITKLISDFLDVSKMKSGSLSLHKEYVPVNMLVQEIIDEVQHANPDIRIIYSGNTDVAVHIDKERMEQVLINFLTNAIKYSPGSSQVKVECVFVDDNVKVSVQDFGIGINKEEHKKIFERFYRVDGKNENKFAGFGIGLFIASEIIQQHHGTIGVESEPGEGSVFYFTLPVSNGS